MNVFERYVLPIKSAEGNKLTVKEWAKKHRNHNQELRGAQIQEMFSNKTEQLYINQVVKTYQGEDRLYIVTELASKWDLMNLIDYVGAVPKESAFQIYAACLVRAIQIMHKEDVGHFDLKPENIFINLKNGYLQVADFGSSKKLKGNQKSSDVLVSTLEYMSPEVARKE